MNMPQPERESNHIASITILTGPLKGKHFKLTEAKNLTLGRGKEMGIQILDKGLSRCHAYLFHSSGKVILEDLKSSNGTFVNKKRIEQPVELKHGDKIFIGATTLILFTDRSTSIEKDESVLIERDEQTNLLNKKACIGNLKRLCDKASNNADDFSVLIIKVDDFEDIVDRYGKDESDELLVQISKMLAKVSRRQDYVCRYSTSEFAIVCPALNAMDTIKFAEFIRSKIDNSIFNSGKDKIKVTVSIGIANYPTSEIQSELEVITNAHEAMHKAENKGKNGTFLAS